MSWKSGRGVGIKDDQVRKVQGIFYEVPTSRRAGIACLREPRGAVGVEVPQDDGVIPGGEE